MRECVIAAAAVIGVIWLCVRAFRNHPGQLLTWPMFSGVTFFLCNLADDRTGESTCLHREYAYCDLIGGEDRLKETLEYLRDQDRRVSGTVTLISSRGSNKTVEIRHSEAVAPTHD